ncbi:MAG: aldo/keto reductase [Bacteroidales bacterium]|nr:MAG: aldo/keto reductase [Bacteroidales bacterium]
MQYKKLANSEITVSVITFGAWVTGGLFWGGADKNQSIKAIHKAIDYGVTSIDTAPVYGFGESEQIVGEAIKGNRDKLQILTKYGLRWDQQKGSYYFDITDHKGNKSSIYRYAGKESIVYECEQSLKRLGTDYIDLYQIHWHDVTTPIEESMEAVAKLISEGKVRAAGVSNYAVEHLEKARSVINIVSDQVPYSMVKRNIEDNLIPYCIKNNISILAYSPLERGLLTGKITPDYKFKPGDNRPKSPFFSGQNLIKINKCLDSIKPLAEERNISLAQLVINWTIRQPGITSVLVGSRNSEQAEENIKAMDFMLDNEEINLINRELEKLELQI